jgi:hypothetical protein
MVSFSLTLTLFSTVLQPSKAILRMLFGEIASSVPGDVLPVIDMCREKALTLFDTYEATTEDLDKDSVGLGT